MLFCRHQNSVRFASNTSFDSFRSSTQLRKLRLVCDCDSRGCSTGQSAHHRDRDDHRSDVHAGSPDPIHVVHRSIEARPRELRRDGHQVRNNQHNHRSSIIPNLHSKHQTFQDLLAVDLLKHSSRLFNTVRRDSTRPSQ